MRKEDEYNLILGNLSEQRDRLHQIIEERKDLYNRIGTGEVNPMSSDKSAVKAGRIREKVQQNIETKGYKLTDIESHILEIQAENFISVRDERQDTLNQIRYFTEQGHLPSEVLDHYEEEFADFNQTSEKVPGLSEKIRRIEADKKQPSPDEIKDVYRRMGEFIEGLPDKKSQRGEVIKIFPEWRKTWLINADKYGNESLYSLFPKELQKNPVLIVRTLRTLARARNKGGVDSILTKSQLMNTSDEVLCTFEGIGEKTIALIHLMKDVVKAERGIEPQQPEIQGKRNSG